MPHRVLVNVLENDAGFAAIAGNRVYPHPAKQRPIIPYVTFQRISDSLRQTLPQPAALIRARYQLNCWSSSYGGAMNVARAVRRALDGLADVTASGVRVHSCRLETTRDMASMEDADQGVSMDFSIFYEEN